MTFYCGGCGKAGQRGIYCPDCRARRAQEARAVKDERGRMLREQWEKDPEGMKAKLAAGRAPAKESGDESA